MRAHAVVLGGAGFVGSHLCERLLLDGWQVTAVDSLITGALENVQTFAEHPAWDLLVADVTQTIPVSSAVDVVFNLASPASPADYLKYPLETLWAGAAGTRNGLQLARQTSARFVMVSTSEVYGDPLIHPQLEQYWGNVNPVGLRSVYDEAKRFAEAITMSFGRQHAVDVGIVRVFNTFGPRMRAGDGRAVPTFITQALRGVPLSVHGDGQQTRSLCYVDDLVNGLVRMGAARGVTGPLNLGNPHEITMLDLAHWIRALTSSQSEIQFVDPMPDDPAVRRPDIGMAQRVLGWEPQVSVEQGLVNTIDHFRRTPAANVVDLAELERRRSLAARSAR